MGDIQTELCLRGCIDVDMPKAQLVAKLKNNLPFCFAVQLVNSNSSTCNDIRFCYASHYITWRVT